MGDDIRATERQPGKFQNHPGYEDEGEHIAEENQKETEPGVHDGWVVQRLANGQVAIQGHHSHVEENG